MKSKTKVIFSLAMAVLFALIVVVGVAIVFAATNQTITSNISVSYTSKEVIGSATAGWYHVNDDYCDDDYGAWQPMSDENGNKEIHFELEELADASLSPNQELSIDELNDFIVFRYNFTNDGTKPYELTLTYEDDDAEDKNVKLYTMATPIGDSFDDWIGGFSAEFGCGLDYDKECYLHDNFTGTLNTTVLPNSTIQIFILLEVENWGADASFSGTMNFELDGTKTEEYTDDFLYYTNGEFATIMGVAKGEPHAEYPDVKMFPNDSLSVPATYNELPVKTIGPGAFWEQTNITTISSFGNVETILYFAFENSSLSGGLTISGTVKHIAGSFDGCSEITSLTLQNGIEHIGYSAFCNCLKLQSVIIPNSVIYIGEYAFGNTALKSVTIPSSVEQIGPQAFELCNNLTNITIDSKTVCDNLLSWDEDADRWIQTGGIIKAKYEIVGIDSDWSKSESQIDGYWEYSYSGEWGGGIVVT